MATVSKTDEEFSTMAREHLNRFLLRTALRLSASSGKMREIGPQNRSEVRQYFSNYCVETLDTVDDYHPTHVGDITKHNKSIPEASYDFVACMEVIEHTLDPFGAIHEIRRILKHSGLLLLSAPLNFRIHGPLPDCWRFTDHGFKVLLRDFEILELDILESPGRDLFPVHYNVLAKIDKFRHTADADLNFRFI